MHFHVPASDFKNEVFPCDCFYLGDSTLLTEKDSDDDFFTSMALKKTHTQSSQMITMQACGKFSPSIKQTLLCDGVTRHTWAFLGVPNHCITRELGHMRLWFVHTKKKEHKHS